MHDHEEKNRGLTLGDIVVWSGGVSRLGAAARKQRVATVWSDSRSVKPGDVFVAVSTEKDDGHRYVAAAFAAGAAAAIVAKKAVVDCTARDRAKLIFVADPLKAVQRVAARYRRELGCLVVGVTGSSGKTTTRSFIAAVLASGYPVGETYTNWNNHIGVPLSLLRFTGDEWAGVIEMGANHEGEIAALTKIVRPDIAVITNVGYAHVGLFGSLAATTRAKFEVVAGLNRQGFLLCNGDDDRVVAYAKKTGVKTVFFGVSKRCEVRPEEVVFDPKQGLSFTLNGTAFRLPVPARHFLYSALPAIFLGRRCGIADEAIAAALAAQKPVAMRGTVEKKKGVSFIVDCYNANPSSMRAAIAQLAETVPQKQRVAVVGDMLELGRYAPALHRELGALLVENGVDRIIAVGQYAPLIAEGAESGGSKTRVGLASNAEEASGLIRGLVNKGDTVLLKGSRGVHLETVYEQY